MYYLCEKYYKSITVQYHRVNCVSWVPRLNLLDLQMHSEWSLFICGGLTVLIWKLSPYAFSTHCFWFYHLGPQRTNFTFLHHSSLKIRRKLSCVYFLKKPNIYWIFCLVPDLPGSPSTLKMVAALMVLAEQWGRLKNQWFWWTAQQCTVTLLSPHLASHLVLPVSEKNSVNFNLFS